MRRRRIATLERHRGVGVDVGQPVHERHDVGAVHARRAGAAEDVAVSGGVDHDPAADRLPARLALHDHAGDRAVLDQGPRKPRMAAQAHAGVEHHLLRDLLPALGVEDGGVHDRLGLLPRVELLEPPAHPAVADGRVVAEAVLKRRRDAGADPLHPVDDLERQPAHRDLALGAHVVEHQDHAAGREPAEVAVALEQRHLGPGAGRRDRGRLARRAPADDQDVGLGHDGSLPARFAHCLRHRCPPRRLSAPSGPGAIPGCSPGRRTGARSPMLPPWPRRGARCESRRS